MLNLRYVRCETMQGSVRSPLPLRVEKKIWPFSVDWYWSGKDLGPSQPHRLLDRTKKQIGCCDVFLLAQQKLFVVSSFAPCVDFHLFCFSVVLKAVLWLGCGYSRPWFGRKTLEKDGRSMEQVLFCYPSLQWWLSELDVTGEAASTTKSTDADRSVLWEGQSGLGGVGAR